MMTTQNRVTPGYRIDAVGETGSTRTLKGITVVAGSSAALLIQT